jgi:uncharacterized protein YbjQ (UPF0145 family)
LAEDFCIIDGRHCFVLCSTYRREIARAELQRRAPELGAIAVVGI